MLRNLKVYFRKNLRDVCYTRQRGDENEEFNCDRTMLQ